jgi:hypothetical protein
MRIVALAMLAAGTLLAAGPARAQTYDPSYPVCLQVWGRGITTYYECRYSSLAQCNASASGRAAHCLVNPYYANANDGRPARGNKHRRAY